MNTMQTHIQLWLLLRCLGSVKSVRNILPRGWVLIIMSEPTCTLLYRNCGKSFKIYFIPYSPNQAVNLEQYINQSTNLPSHSMERSGSHSVRSSNRQSELACLDAMSKMRRQHPEIRKIFQCCQGIWVMRRQAAHLYLASWCSRTVGRCYGI